MALIHCDFFSETLGLSSSICVILPQNTKNQIGISGSEKKDKYPVLYLLHGLSDDHTIWQRRTSIERYVSNLGLAVVMPDVARSYYTDMKYGLKYWMYISEELPQIVQSFFPISSAREDNFAAGLSMGGFGAFKLVLNNPDKFAAGASLSGAVNMVDRVLREQSEARKHELYSVFGEPSSIKNSNNDLFHIVDNLSNSRTCKPKLFQCCGTEDFLYEDNIRFKNFIEGKGFDYTYEEGPGSHDWGYWDREIQRILQWLPIKR